MHRRNGFLGRRTRRALRWAAAVTLVAVVAVPAWNAFGLWRTWRNVERETYDLDAYRQLPLVVDDAETAAALPPAAGEVLVAAMADDSVGDPADDVYDTYLIVGSDEGDHRADVILLVLVPHDGSAPLMVSLPRDLYLPNRCTGGLTRLNANFNGCGAEINGATQLAGAVEDFTGLQVDHFALFTFDGFETIIDALGGTEICVDHPVREAGKLDLPAGCTQATGAQALGWMRSRFTQEYVDGRWRTMPGVDDLARNQRQQELILSMGGRLADFDSPQQLLRFVDSLGDAFTLDDRLGLRDAVDLAWTNRHVRPDGVVRMTIPVEPHTTAAGAQVLLPTSSFAEVVAGHRSPSS